MVKPHNERQRVGRNVGLANPRDRTDGKDIPGIHPSDVSGLKPTLQRLEHLRFHYFLFLYFLYLSCQRFFGRWHTREKGKGNDKCFHILVPHGLYLLVIPGNVYRLQNT